MVINPLSRHSPHNNQNKKNILILDEFGPENFAIYRLMMGLELEAMGCDVHFIRLEPNSRTLGKTLHSDGYSVNLSELKRTIHEKAASPEYIYCIDSVIQTCKENPRIKSTRIEERHEETYLVYPDIVQDVRKVNGLFAARMGVKPVFGLEKQFQKKLLKINPDIHPYVSSNVFDIADDKLAFQPYLEKAGVLTPKTVRLPYTKDGYSLKNIEDKIQAKEIPPPYIVKSGRGSEGHEVFCLDTIEQAYEKICSIQEKGDGAVLQDKIPNPPELIKGYGWLRIIVHDEEILSAIKSTNPNELGASANTNRSSGNVLESYVPSDQQKATAIAATKAIAKETGESFVCGVDMSLTTPPVIFEINEGPGMLPQLSRGENLPRRIAEIFNDKIDAHQKTLKASQAR